MKKNLPLIIATVILVGILAYLKYNKSSSNFEEIEFAVSDVDKIGSIILSDKLGNKSRFTKRENKWWVNDSIEADRAKMIILLSTIQKLQVEVPVSDSMRKQAIDDLRQFGKEVVIMDKDGDEIKSYFIGNSLGNGNFMILREDGIVGKDPYIVKVPGVQAIDLKHRFATDPSMWYSNEVFATPIDKIKEVKVQFLEQPEYSFILTKDEELVKIDPIKDSFKINQPLNQNAVVQFLLEFELKNFENRLTNDTAIKYIKTTKPIYHIELTDVFDKKQQIDLYRIPSHYLEMFDGVTHKDAQGRTLPFSLDKYWAYIPHKKEYAIAQHYVFGPVLLPYMYFFEKGK